MKTPFKQTRKIPYKKIIITITFSLAMLFCIAMLNYSLEKSMGRGFSSLFYNHRNLETDVVGQNISLNSHQASSCEINKTNDSCRQLASGTDYLPGIYTIQISYDFKHAKKSSKQYIQLLLNLDDYEGLTQKEAQFYINLYPTANRVITLQNVPLVDKSVIYLSDDTNKFDYKIRLIVQDQYIKFDFNNQIPGFYIPGKTIPYGTYTVHGNPTTQSGFEYIPTSYEDYDSSKLYNFFYTDSEYLTSEKNTLIGYYDSATTITKETK